MTMSTTLRSRVACGVKRFATRSALRAALIAVCTLLGTAQPALAGYVNRFSTTTNGAVTFTGNALGLNKNANQNSPGTSGSIGAFISPNTGLQVSSFPAGGTTLQWAQNGSSAQLVIPAGSTVLYAELVWSGSYSYGGQDVSANLNTSVGFTTPAGSSSIAPAAATSQTLGTAGANGTCTTGPCFYVRSQNVTSQVAAGGSGSYTVAGVPATVGASENNSNTAGWTLAVVYGNASLPARNLTVFVGAETAGAAAASITGFCTPTSGALSGRLMVSALEGDPGITGDQMKFGPTAGSLTALSGPNNLIGNFFSSQINKDNGSLDTSGSFGTYNQSNNAAAVGRQGYDITNIDVSSTLLNSQTSAVAQGTTTGDQYTINALGLQVNVGAPIFPTAVKTVDKATTFVGDTLTYSVVLNNGAGTADATNVIFTDAPPPGTTFVANSFTVGGVTQAGANPSAGVNIGTIAAGASRTVGFQVTVTSIPAGPAVAQYSNTATWAYQYVSCVGQPTSNGSLTTNPVVTTIARLVPTKTVAPTGSVYPGQTLTYTIAVPNTGTANSAGTTLQDSIPAGTSYVLNSTQLNGLLVVDAVGVMPFVVARQINSPTRAAGQINVGETATVTFQVTVNAGVAGPITNTAVVDVDGPGVAPTVSAQAVANVVLLAPTKSVSPTGSVAPGQTLTYTINVPNNGSGTSAGTTLADPIPTGTTYVASSTTLNGAGVADVSGAMPFATARQINSPTGAAGQVVAGATATVQFKVTVNANPGPGPITNTATVDPDGPGTAAASTAQAASTIVLPDLVMSKSHTGNFVAGQTGSYTLQVSNASGAGTISNGPITVTDTMPTGLTVAAIPSGTNWDCSATVLGSTSASCAYNGTFPVAGGTSLPAITLVVNVGASVAGLVTNSATVSTAFGETMTTNNTALDPTNVVAKPTIAKAFAPAQATVGGSSTLTLTVTNSASVPLTGVAFTDTFPAGLVVAAAPALTNTCGGAITGGAAGNNSLNLGGGTVGANSTCQVTVSVTAPVSGTYNNNSSGASSNETGSAGTPSNVAQLSVAGAPAMTKAFSPTVIASGGTSTLTFSVTNNNNVALTGLAFADTYPSNLTNTVVPVVTNTCGGLVTAASSGGSVSLSGGTLAANSTCAVSVTVTASIRATYNNVSGAVSSTNGGTGNTASASLTVAGNPLFGKAFSPSTIPAGGSSQMTFTLSNTSAVPVTAIAFTDVFPSGMVIAPSAGLTNSCNGTITGGAAGNNNINLSGGSLAALGSCSITVNVTASAPGSYTNVTGAVTSSAGTGDAANAAVLVVTSPASITKAFNPSSILANGNSTMSFVIANPNAIPLTNLAFSDPFPGGGLQVAGAPNVTNSCGGTVNGGTVGSTNVSLSAGTLAANASCTITVVVTSPVPGTFSNTTTGVTSNQTAQGTGANAVVLTAVSPDLRLTKTHTGTFTVGVQGSYTLTVNNTLGTAPTTGTITVTDTLPTGLSYIATGSGGTGWSCSAAGQIVTCTSGASIATGATSGAPITINVGVDAVAVPRVTNAASVAGGGEPSANANNNDAYDPTVVNLPAANTFAPDGAQTALAGTAVFYAHRFNAGSAGNVSFASSAVATPAIAGWSELIYRDANCNGVLDGSEGNAPIGGSVAVIAGDSVCVILKEFVPAGASQNAQNLVSLTASFTPASGPVQTIVRTDVTTVGSAGGAGLVLAKSVRNVTTAGTAAASNTAKPGETLEYTITYTNNGADALASILLNDATPAYTRFVSAACGTPLPNNIGACVVSTQPAVNATGGIVWTLTGTLAAGASGSVVFRVQLE